MTVRVAINGFGRIGRLVLRAAYEHELTEIEVVGINDLGPVETNAHLLRYDSVHGRFLGEVTSGDNWIDIGRGKIRVTAERDPARLPWRELGVDVALECTGIFTRREAAVQFGWERWLGHSGAFIGMTGFGASAPGEALYPHFGITPEKVAEAARSLL